MTGSNETSAQAKWAADQRALARALGLTIEQWCADLAAAGARRTGLTAAVVGAAMAKGLGLGVLAKLDGPALAERAAALIDPAPPQVADPIIAEAIRRADELDASAGKGASRLRRRPSSVETPQRQARPIGSSATGATADAPGLDEDDQ